MAAEPAGRPARDGAGRRREAWPAARACSSDEEADRYWPRLVEVWPAHETYRARSGKRAHFRAGAASRLRDARVPRRASLVPTLAGMRRSERRTGDGRVERAGAHAGPALRDRRVRGGAHRRLALRRRHRARDRVRGRGRLRGARLARPRIRRRGCGAGAPLLPEHRVRAQQRRAADRLPPLPQDGVLGRLPMLRARSTAHVPGCPSRPSRAWSTGASGGGPLYLQYWFYYPESFTGGIGRMFGDSWPGYHPDDWEGYQVRVSPGGGVSARATAHGGYGSGWGPWTGWMRVSGGSHAGHLVDRSTGERSTPASKMALVPLERLEDADRYGIRGVAAVAQGRLPAARVGSLLTSHYLIAWPIAGSASEATGHTTRRGRKRRSRRAVLPLRAGSSSRVAWRRRVRCLFHPRSCGTCWRRRPARTPALTGRSSRRTRQGSCCPQGFTGRQIARGGTLVDGTHVPVALRGRRHGHLSHGRQRSRARFELGDTLRARRRQLRDPFRARRRDRAGLPDPRGHQSQLRRRSHPVGDMAFLRGARGRHGLGGRPSRHPAGRAPSRARQLLPRGGGGGPCGEVRVPDRGPGRQLLLPLHARMLTRASRAGCSKWRSSHPTSRSAGARCPTRT